MWQKLQQQDQDEGQNFYTKTMCCVRNINKKGC